MALYKTVERLFFNSLTKKIVGNVIFLCVPFLLLLLVGYYFFAEIKLLVLTLNIDAHASEQLLAVLDSFWQASVITLFVAVAVALFSVFFMRSLFLWPINSITQLLKQVNENNGDISATLPEHSYDEISEMARSYNQFTARVKKMIAQCNRSF